MRRGPLPALAAAALALSGCLGAGEASDDVSLTVTRDFGSASLLELARPEVHGSDTVMRLLQRNAEVRTRYGGGFVQAIGDVEGGRRKGRPYDWFFYVNGTLAEEGATAIDLNGGDRIWWDHHDWGVTPRVPAVVGSYPAPFVRGDEGKRLPVRVECEDPRGPACETVADKLIELGVPAGRAGLGASAADDTLRVLVAPWRRLRGSEAEADALDDGPRRSGVFARFDDSGSALTVLDDRGRPARRLGPGTGLVAATRVEGRKPLWFVTGTDPAGVAAAARALGEATLKDRYALVIARDRPVSVPLAAGGQR